MGKRSTEITGKSATLIKALAELHDMLDQAAHRDGQPTMIEIIVRGKETETMSFELENLEEAIAILKLNKP